SGAWCFDIVTPEQRRSSCFTHSYGKFIRGTGSILYTGPVAANDCEGDALPRAELFELADPKDRAYDESWSKRINWEEDMRYLSGTEIARLFGFPVDCASDGPTAMRSFEFPSTCTMKQVGARFHSSCKHSSLTLLLSSRASSTAVETARELDKRHRCFNGGVRRCNFAVQ
ncbi:hypothetical protein THAOC_06560, partial [Thalassiosira oceanica]